MLYDESMYRADCEMPASLLIHTDRTGNKWHLDANNCWWLRYRRIWLRADSPESRDVYGVPVPPEILSMSSTSLMTIDHISPLSSAAWLAGIGSLTANIITTQSLGMPPRTTAVPSPAPPNIPPDFVDLPPGPDCCRECHLDDGPLYVGGLCRYCWMLHALPNPIAPRPIAPSLSTHSAHDYAWTAILLGYAIIFITILISHLH